MNPALLVQLVYNACADKVISNARHYMCPTCGNVSSFQRWGSYQRYYICNLQTSTGVLLVEAQISIKRLRCNKDGHTHALIPDYITPYKIYSIKLILEMILEISRIEADSSLNNKQKAAAKRKVLDKYKITRDQANTAQRIFRQDKILWLGVTLAHEIGNIEFIERLYSGDLPEPPNLLFTCKVPKNGEERPPYVSAQAEFYNATRQSYGTGHPDPIRRKGGKPDKEHLTSFAPYLPNPMRWNSSPVEGYAI